MSKMYKIYKIEERSNLRPCFSAPITWIYSSGPSTLSQSELSMSKWPLSNRKLLPYKWTKPLVISHIFSEISFWKDLGTEASYVVT